MKTIDRTDQIYRLMLRRQKVTPTATAAGRPADTQKQDRGLGRRRLRSLPINRLRQTGADAA